MGLFSDKPTLDSSVNPPVYTTNRIAPNVIPGEATDQNGNRVTSLHLSSSVTDSMRAKLCNDLGTSINRRSNSIVIKTLRLAWNLLKYPVVAASGIATDAALDHSPSDWARQEFFGNRATVSSSENIESSQANITPAQVTAPNTSKQQPSPSLSNSQSPSGLQSQSEIDRYLEQQRKQQGH